MDILAHFKWFPKIVCFLNTMYILEALYKPYEMFQEFGIPLHLMHSMWTQWQLWQLTQGLEFFMAFASLDNVCNQCWLNLNYGPHNLSHPKHLYLDSLLFPGNIVTCSFYSLLIFATLTSFHLSKVYHNNMHELDNIFLPRSFPHS